MIQSGLDCVCKIGDGLVCSALGAGTFSTLGKLFFVIWGVGAVAARLVVGFLITVGVCVGVGVGVGVIVSNLAGDCVLATVWAIEREFVAVRFGLVLGRAIGSGSATVPRARRLDNFDAGTLGVNCCPPS